MITAEDFDDILAEVNFRVPEGVVDLTKESHVSMLIDVLREYGVNDANELAQNARIYFLYLTEAEESQAAQQAHKLGLVSLGYGRWGKAKGGPATHVTSQDGNLVPVGQDNDPNGTSGNADATGEAPPQVLPHTDFQTPAEKEREKEKQQEPANGEPPANSSPTDVTQQEPAQQQEPSGVNKKFGNKDKTLAKVDTLHSKEFAKKPQEGDNTFYTKTKKSLIGPPPPKLKLPKDIYENAKVAPRHLNELERMMNSKFDPNTAKWSHFSDLPGGAGQISAQAGELMTLISTTMDDNMAAKFFRTLIEHEAAQVQSNPKLQNESSRIVTKSWIAAAINNRKAIRHRLAKQYPDAQIEAGSWDTQGEVEAMGLQDYKKNKGFSTDAYFKIKTKDGDEILDEVSLKKSVAVNFLNSGTGLFKEWDPNLPPNIDPNVYSTNERKSLLKFGSKNIRALAKAALKDKELQSIIKSKGVSLKDALTRLQSGKSNRGDNKVIMASIQSAAAQGDKASKAYLEVVQKIHKKHQKDIIAALGSNKKLKMGMLASIRNEFPLKAVGEGEEAMAIGPNSLDRAIMEKIFNTHDFEQIKQGLVAVTNAEPPYLAYKAGAGGKVIPIATIVVREDGVGYGGAIKFEMTLDKRFAKILEQANKEVYGG